MTLTSLFSLFRFLLHPQLVAGFSIVFSSKVSFSDYLLSDFPFEFWVCLGFIPKEQWCLDLHLPFFNLFTFQCDSQVVFFSISLPLLNSSYQWLWSLFRVLCGVDPFIFYFWFRLALFYQFSPWQIFLWDTQHNSIADAVSPLWFFSFRLIFFFFKSFNLIEFSKAWCS
jgi:hypothetical protein